MAACEEGNWVENMNLKEAILMEYGSSVEDFSEKLEV